jgi:hypothetical protein
MTAPVITGGSITGVALSGNTLTSPVITGGSINNTPIGASTANTGAFTTLGASGVATFSAGTVSAPAITTTGDTNTGIFFPAADTIAFTEGGVESMRIDSSGNVLVGTATAQELLTVNKNAAFGTTADAFSELRFFNSTSTAGTTRVRATAGALAFLTSNAEAMRIDASQNVGIGTSSPAYDLQVSKTVAAGSVISQVNNPSATGAARLYLGNDSGESAAYFQVFGSTHAVKPSIINIGGNANYPLVFDTAGIERMRIDSSGNLLVGTTSLSGTERFSLLSSVGDWSQVIRNSNASPFGLFINYTTATPNSSGNAFFTCYDNNATNERFTVRSNGGIANYSGNNVNLSDVREKINIEPASSYLDKICAIPVKTFNYIDQNREEDDGLTLGVIAQDVQAVAPELVMESNWGTKDEPKMRLSIYQTDLQYALMKSIQELKSELDSVKAELQTLKGN